jgi:hypothetical protein
MRHSQARPHGIRSRVLADGAVMILLRAFPFLALVVLAYNALIVFGSRPTGVVAGQVRLPSGDLWSISTGDVFVVTALAFLFVELVSASARTVSIVNHALSLILLLICVIEFLLVQGCGTPEFLFITLIVAIDVVAGYSISVRLARRDLALASE